MEHTIVFKMSKMPAKKKSCFQITSVTQAQVAASSITDDTESLDDPDESRTEDVSSEIFDVSRADYDPEVCDISSSEETLNNVSETEVTTSVIKSHIPQDVHISSVSGPPNGGVAYRNSGAAHANAHVVGGNMPATTYAASTQQSTTAAASQSYSTPQPPPAASSSTTTSCSSRFRVIKLDHGTGEPFKRGRWMCTEFYDKESESSSASRTVDSSKHVVTLDHSVDRDTGGSVATHSESASESGYVSAAPGEMQAQSYGISHQAFGGASQSLAAPGHNGVPTSMHMQKSPSMPPSTQPQPFPYSTQQQQHHPPTLNLPSVMPTPQPDYRQQQQQQHQSTVAPQPPGPTTSTSTHTLPVASLPVGAPLSQGPSPVMTPAGVPVHMLGLVTHVGDSVGPAGGSLSSGPPPSAQGLPHQQSAGGAGAAVGVLLQGGGVVHPQQPAQSSGQAVPAAMIPGILSGNTGVPQTMPSQTLAGGVSIQSQPQTSRSGAPQSEETRRKSDALPQPTGMPGKDTGKSVIPEGLTLGAPVVNSFFGIPISIDGDEDR